MKKIVIIKTGNTFPELANRRGDFEDWILNGMGLERQDAQIVDVSQGEALPFYPAVSGVVITGSHVMVTDHLDWSERTAQWLKDAVEHEIPILAICYGHQLLAYACGGTVGDNPEGLEFGTVKIQLTEEANSDLLFKHVSQTFQANAIHTQSVLLLPPEAQVLASSEMDEHHAFVLGTCVWGLQFHPEFDADVTKTCIREHASKLRKQGIQPEPLLQKCQDTPESAGLLARFYDIVKELQELNISKNEVY